MSKLPKGWVTSDIGSICEYIQRGKSPKYDRDNEKYPVINQKCIRWGYIDPEHLKFVTSDFWKSVDDVRFLQKGDILWNSTGTGTLGRAAIFFELSGHSKAIVDSHVTILRSHVGVDPKYLYYWIQSPYIQNKIERMQSGTTNQVELSKGVIENAYIYLAPKNEQRRIVEKLDQIFAEIDSIKSRLGKLPSIFENSRVSILNHALSGVLTKNGSANTSPSNKHQPLKKEQGVNHILPNTWKSRSLGEIADVIDPNPRHRNPPYYDKGFVFLSTAQFSDPDGWDYSDVNYVSEETVLEQEKRCSFTYRSIAFSRKGTIGKTRFLPTDIRFALLDSVVVINPSDLLDEKFLNYCLRANVVQEQVAQKTRGVALKQITVGAVRSLMIPLPPIEEQKEIAKKLDRFFALVNEAEAKYNRTVEQIENVIPSVLNKAFSGELAPQDPSDEHASILLKKIKAEKQHQISIPQNKSHTTHKRKKVGTMISSVLDTLKKEKKPLTAQSLLEKSGYPRDADSETIEKFFLDIRKHLVEGTIVREKVQEEDVFKLAA